MAILNTNIKNSNIKFLNGLQSDLNYLISHGGAAKGAFYLTSDTHRLYIGQEDNNRSDLASGTIVPVPINEGIITVEEITDLPSTASDKQGVAGTFYYVTGTAQNPVNILCVYNGQQWVQINPDTNTYISRFFHNLVSTASTAVKITSTLKDNNDNEINANLEIFGANGITVSAVSDSSFDANNNFVSNARKQITITGDSYGITSTVTSTANKATITLASSDTNKSSSSVNIIGKNNIAIGEENGDITITGTDIYLSNLAFSNAANSGNGFRLTGTYNNTNTTYADFDPVIHLDVDNGTDYHFINGKAELPLYTKNEIDTILRQQNAMVYKGVIGYGQLYTVIPTGSTASTATILSNGDTFKIGAGDSTGSDQILDIRTGVSSTATVHKGDLIIAQGTEYTSSNYPQGHPELIGIIDPTTLHWGYVPSGDDTFIETTYRGYAIQHGLKIANNSQTTIAQLKVETDNTYLAAVDTETTYSGNNIPVSQTITINHKLIDTNTYSDNTVAISSTSTQTKHHDITIPVITDIQRDAAGHVQKITTTNYKIQDSVSTVSNYAFTTTGIADNSYARVKSNIVLKDENGSEVSNKNAEFIIESSTMQVTASTKTISTDTFNSVKMELVWGSFSTASV